MVLVLSRTSLRSDNLAQRACPCPKKSLHARDSALRPASSMCACPCPRDPALRLASSRCACPCPRYPASTCACPCPCARKGTQELDKHKARTRGPTALCILHSETSASEAFCRASTSRRMAMDRIRVRSPAYHRSCAARSSSRCCPLESNDLTSTRGEAIRCQQPQRGHEPSS